jgi:hypothetical protein
MSVSVDLLNSKSDDGHKMELHEHPDRGVYVKDLTMVTVVSVHLIRHSNNNVAKKDDVVVIKPQDNNIFVDYTDNQDGYSSKQKLYIGKNDLGRYIRNLGHLFLSDVEPFKEAQFNFPGFPSFMVNHRSLKDTDTQDALMEIADLVSASWFTDDMPPLVPQESNYSYTGHY